MPPTKRIPGPLTHRELLENLDYDCDSGVFTWKSPGPRRTVGAAAGYRHCSGYRKITVCGREWFEHRLVWFWMTGSPPPDDLQVDHINVKRDDNRWINLRLVDQGANLANSPRYGDMRGIMNRGSSYRVRLNVSGSRTTASFKTLEEAIEYRDSVFRQQWGHDVINS